MSPTSSGSSAGHAPVPLCVVRCHGLVLLQSPLLLNLGVPHAFSTRLGGVSPTPYASLNLGSLTGDRTEHVGENRRRLCAALGFAAEALRSVHQVHGCEVAPDASAAAGDVNEAEAYQADALVTGDPSALLSVRTADCLPVLLATADGRHVAAVHAGWRGLAAGIIGGAVATLAAQAEVSCDRVVAAVGPGIGPECYLVGTDVAAGFPAECARLAGPGQFHLNLRRAAELSLRAAGVVRYDLARHCTACEPALFYSHRRDGAATGRQVAAIAPRAG